MKMYVILSRLRKHEWAIVGKALYDSEGAALDALRVLTQDWPEHTYRVVGITVEQIP